MQLLDKIHTVFTAALSPRVSTNVRLAVETERADSAWDGKSRDVRFLGAHGGSENIFSPVQLTTSRNGSYIRVIVRTLLYMIIIPYA